MRTQNARAIDTAEAEHLALVKMTACVLCDAPPPVQAHHVEQGHHFTALGLCEHCHTGRCGVHGDQTMLRLKFKAGGQRGELLALNETLRRVAALRRKPA